MAAFATGLVLLPGSAGAMGIAIIISILSAKQAANFILSLFLIKLGHIELKE